MFDAEAAINARIAEKTPQEREEWDRYQKEQHSKASQSERPDARILLGQRMVAQAEAYLRESDRPDESFTWEQMAEGFALQGDFGRAYFLTTNPEKEKFYKQVLDADDMECVHGKMFLYDRYPGMILFMCPVCRKMRKVNA